MQSDRATPTRRPAPWGDPPGDPRYVLEVGRRAMAAEAPWRLAAVPDVPDTILDTGQVGPVVVRAASTRGTSHRFYGTPREDAAGVVNVDDRFVVAAVADGIGSVPGSAKAARIAVHFSLRYLNQYFWEHPEAADHDLGPVVREAITRANVPLDQPWSGPATTLTVAVLSTVPGGSGTYPYAVSRVGDSPAFVLAGGQFTEVFAASDRDGLHTTQTDGLPVSLLQGVPVAPGRLDRGEVLLLTTDGLGTPLASDDVQEMLAARWHEPPDPVDFLTHVQFRRKSYDDDRSTIAIWAPPDGPPAAQPRRLPAIRPDQVPRPDHELPGPEAVLDAGLLGGLEVRAASIHRGRPGWVGVVTAGDDRLVAALASGPPTGGPLHQACRDAVRDSLARVRECLVSDPAEPIETLLAPIVAKTPLLLAVVDGAHRFTVAQGGGGTAYCLTGGVFELVDGGSGRLAGGEALVLAGAGLGLGPRLAEQWGAGPPGPSQFLDALYGPPGSGDQSAVVVWSAPGDAT